MVVDTAATEAATETTEVATEVATGQIARSDVKPKDFLFFLIRSGFLVFILPKCSFFGDFSLLNIHFHFLILKYEAT